MACLKLWLLDVCIVLLHSKAKNTILCGFWKNGLDLDFSNINQGLTSSSDCIVAFRNIIRQAPLLSILQKLMQDEYT